MYIHNLNTASHGSLTLPGRPPVGELKKVGKSRIFWQKVGGFFTKVGKGRIIFSLF